MLTAASVTQIAAQTAITVGNQVTSADDLVSGQAYVLQYTSNSPYIEDIGDSYSAPKAGNTANVACVYYLYSENNGTWKIKNYYTGKYWPAGAEKTTMVPQNEANAGSWSLTFSDAGAVTPKSNGYGLDRLDPNLVSWQSSSANTIKIYNITEAVTVNQGYQTAGRGSELMLLQVNVTQWDDLTDAALNISFKDGAENQISAVTLYETTSSSPEIMSTGSGAPSKTQIAQVENPSANVSFSLGNISGCHGYWIGATVKSSATLGAILDAAVTSLTYTLSGESRTWDLTDVGDPADRGAMVFDTRTYPFLPRDNGSRVYRIPAVVTADGSIIAACDKRYDSYKDIGSDHVIDIVVRRSTDGGKTWGDPVTVAKGDATNDATCGYGDPSLTKGKDGKLYCLFGAGNTGFFYGLNRICMVTSTDNGATWSAIQTIAPSTESSAGITFTDHASLYDYFVTSGKGLYTHDGVLMFLLDAQTASEGSQQNYVLYSTDDGATWHIDATLVCTGANEAKLEQANDGTLIASIRTNGNRCYNLGSYEKNNDGTCTFTWTYTSPIGQWTDMRTSAGNNQDIFYYSRANEIGSGSVGASTGKPDILLHTMTTGSHANLNLYMSIDGGSSWTSVCQIQPKGSRYAVMTKLSNDDLGILFEDQGLNATASYTDYNHYPINFLTITKEQLLAMAEPLMEAAEDADMDAVDVKVVYGTTAHTTYGTLSGDTWTSASASGLAGVTLTKPTSSTFDKYSSLNSKFNLAYKVSDASTSETLTLSAPAGYKITGYSLKAVNGATAAYTYTLTAADGTTSVTTTSGSTASYQTLSVTGVNAASTTLTVQATAVNWLAIADFVITIVKDGVSFTDMKVTNNDATSYGTLSSNVWTSGESSGMAGVVVSATGLTLTTPTAWSCTVLGAKVDAGNGNTARMRLQAPAGYLIKDYSYSLQNWSSGNSFTVTPIEGTGSAVTISNHLNATSGSVTEVNSNVAHLDITATTQTNPLCFRSLTITLYNTLKPSTTITYAIVDDEGNVVTQVDDVSTYLGYVPVLPTSSLDKRAFCTYPEDFYKDAACTTPLTKVHSTTETVYSRYVFDGPFEFSTVKNPKWYLLYSRKKGDTDLYYANVSASAFNTTVQTDALALYDDTEYHWALIGNPYQTQVLNREGGYLSAAAYTAATNGSAVASQVVAGNDSYPYHDFSLFGFTNGDISNTLTPFALALNGSNKKTWMDGADVHRLIYHGNITVNDALKICNWNSAGWEVIEVPTTYPVTLNPVGDASYATLYLPFDVTTDSNTRAYVITEVSGGYAKMTELTGGEIAANTAVVLVNESAATATFNVASGLIPQVTEAANSLKGTLVSRTLDLGDGTNYYAMGVNSGKIGFYKFDNGSTTSITLGANKAYLETPASGGSVKGFTLSFDGSEDGIHPLDNLTNDNLRSVNGVWYNLAGQRVSPSAAKGIYIVGGKTIVIK